MGARIRSPFESMNSSEYPEFAVRREAISGFFQPPLPTSTFHDLVNRGRIIPIKGLRGFYKLNESLKRLGLREVPSLDAMAKARSVADILRLAFALIDPLVFQMPAWAINEVVGSRDMDHAILRAQAHREKVASLHSQVEKLAYLESVIAEQAACNEVSQPPG